MRVTPVVAGALILSISGSLLAQEYVEYVSRQDRFSITFPVQPKVTETTFTSQFGGILPARIYTADANGSHYSVTVVDYNDVQTIDTAKSKGCPVGAETCIGGLTAGSATGAGYWKADLAGAVTFATYQLLQRDAKLLYLGWNSIDLVEGNMISLANANKTRTSAAIYMHENKLYILEGTSPPGYPVPDFFQQSVGWLDENGNGIRYQTLYHNGFPKPAITRNAGQGGQGQGAQTQGAPGGNAGR
jgi:hypothetical protein